MFKQYIDSLLENIPKKENPVQIDIVLEGGSNNGFYELGILLFLKEMEKTNQIVVNRISGASIGSYMGFHYFNNTLEKTPKLFENMREHFKKNLNIQIYKDLLHEDFKMLSDETFNSLQKNKLYTTTIDINQKKIILKDSYENKEDLEESIFKSCYIPYICGETLCYKNQYMDGIIPHIFNNRDKHNQVKILYISINQLKKISKMFQAKELNMNGRILEGIIDCYKFFLEEKPSYFCSYVNDWNFFNFLIIRSKQYFVFSFIFFLHITIMTSRFLYPTLKDYHFVTFLSVIFKNLYKDFILYLCF